jgi:hypothetical protein
MAFARDPPDLRQSDICREFHENPKRNPRTGKVLHYGKKPYLALVEECGEPPISPKRSRTKVKQSTISQKSTAEKEIIPILPGLLPAEIILEEIIMKNKDLSTLIATCKTNKFFQDLCNNEEFWHKLFNKYYGRTDIMKFVTFTSWYDLFKLCFLLDKLRESELFAIVGAETMDLPDPPKSAISIIYTVIRIYAYRKKLKTIPSELGVLINLLFVTMETNQITIIPPELGNLTNLYYLHLGDNKITIVPPELGKLINLEELYLDRNKIKVIPPELGNLTKLTKLILWKNEIENIPPELGNLSNLDYLNLDENRLTSIPSSLGNLPKISDLSMRNNRIKELPVELKNLGNGKWARITVINNPYIKIPKELEEAKNIDILY